MSTTPTSTVLERSHRKTIRWQLISRKCALHFDQAILGRETSHQMRRWTRMVSSVVVLVTVCLSFFCRQTKAMDHDELLKRYNHVETSCDVENCVAGGCLFENCAQPLSCTGGLCYFRSATFSMSYNVGPPSLSRNCKQGVCEGGACVFDHTNEVSCPGGACRFKNMDRTLTEGYCTGGGCKLNGEPHPTNFEAILSE